MKTEIRQKIEQVVKTYSKCVLFRDTDGHFGAVIRAVIKKNGGNISILGDELQGGIKGPCLEKDLEKCAIIVCCSNEIYAEEARNMLIDAGYHNIFVPKDFGLIYSADKLDGIEFNLNIGCSLNCHYCPQGVLINAYTKYAKNPQRRHLTFEDFKFIIDERMNPGASISFSGMSEPFENHDFFRMLIYASENGNMILLNTTLMGLTESMLDEMIRKEVTLDESILHIPDNKENSHFKITNAYINVLKKFIKHYHKSFTYLTCHGDAPHEAVEEIVKNSGIENIHFESMMGARCGNLDETIREKLPTRKGRLICTLSKSACRAPVCIPDGTLALCCNDYALDTNIGNILDNEWGTIASGKGFQSYLKAMDDENIEYIEYIEYICRHCELGMNRKQAIQAVYPDYLCYGDNYHRVRKLIAEGQSELAKRLQRAEHICIFGLGKFFKDNYFQAGWDKVIQADLLSDNNEALWGREFGGLAIVPKQHLVSYSNLLVIVYTMTPQPIINDLLNIGICDLLSIADIMNVFGGV